MSDTTSDLERLRVQAVEWHRETFGETEDVWGKVEHLRREANELWRHFWGETPPLPMFGEGPPKAAPCRRTDFDHTEVAEELADLFILWASLGAMLQLDMPRFIGAKLEKNRGRRWGEADAMGVREHVRGR